MTELIDRLLANGGVLLAEKVGAAETGIKFRFFCPVCRKQDTNDQEMEPMCTGPRWTHDHEPTVMVRIR